MVYLGLSHNGSHMLWMLIYPLAILANLISTSGLTTAINSSKNASTNTIQDSTADYMVKDFLPAGKSWLHTPADAVLKKTEKPIPNVIDMNKNQKATPDHITADTAHDPMADVDQHQTEDNQADISIQPANIVGITAYSESFTYDNQNTEFEELKTITEDSATLTVSSSQGAECHIGANVNSSSRTIETEYSPTADVDQHQTEGNQTDITIQPADIVVITTFSESSTYDNQNTEFEESKTTTEDSVRLMVSSSQGTEGHIDANENSSSQTIETEYPPTANVDQPQTEGNQTDITIQPADIVDIATFSESFTYDNQNIEFEESKTTTEDSATPTVSSSQGAECHIDANVNSPSQTIETEYSPTADVHQPQTEDNQAYISIQPADIVVITTVSESSTYDNQNTEFEESKTTTEDPATLTVSSSKRAEGHIDANVNYSSQTIETEYSPTADVDQRQTEGNQADITIQPADIVAITTFSESSTYDNQNTEFEESETTTEDSATPTVSSSQGAEGHMNANLNPSSQTIKAEYSSTGNLETINTTSIRLSHISDTFDEVSLIGAVKDGANAPIHQTYSSDDDSHKTSSVDVIGKGNDMLRQEIMKTGKRKPATRVVSKIKRDFSRVAGTFGVDSAVERKNARYSQYQSDRKHDRRPLGDPDFHSNSDKRLGYVQNKKEYDGLKRQHTTGSYSDLQSHRKLLGVNDKVIPLSALLTAHYPKQSGTTKPPSVFYVDSMRSKGLVAYKAESLNGRKMIRKSHNGNPYNPSSGFESTPKAGEVTMLAFQKVDDSDDSSTEQRLKKFTAPRSLSTNSDNHLPVDSIINTAKKARYMKFEHILSDTGFTDSDATLRPCLFWNSPVAVKAVRNILEKRGIFPERALVVPDEEQSYAKHQSYHNKYEYPGIPDNAAIPTNYEPKRDDLSVNSILTIPNVQIPTTIDLARLNPGHGAATDSRMNRNRSVLPVYKSLRFSPGS